MKTLNKIVLGTLSLGTLLFASCDSILNQQPYGQFTEEQMDENAVEGLLASAYAGLEAHFFGNNEAFAGPSTNWIFDVRSDDALKGGGGISMEGNIHQLEISNIFSDNVSGLDKWKNNYYAISRVHRAMLAIKGAESITNKNQYLGELKTLRAFYYFDLVRIFQYLPYFTENDDASATNNTTYTQADIYRFIQQDLREAYRMMDENAPSAGRFNKYAAAALMAKACAYTQDWDSVIVYADYVIGSGKYALYPRYQDMSKIDFNNTYESIIALQCSTADDNAHINWSNLLNVTYSAGNLYGNGDDFFYGSQNLADAFRTDANGLPYLDESLAPSGDGNRMNGGYRGNMDPRVDFTMARLGLPFRGHLYTRRWCRAYDTYGEFSGKKWLVEPENDQMVRGFPWGASNLNFIFLRYADIILLYAEALIEQNKNLDVARQYINMIREKAARSVDPYYSPVDVNPMISTYKVGEYLSAGWTQDYARKAVRMERRLELAMEGHRWFDLCRWGIAVETMNEYYRTESELRSYLRGASLSPQDVYMPTPIDEVRTADGLYK